jgi:uncharacterized protein (TIGR02599 family)
MRGVREIACGRRAGGFTILELLVATAVMSLVLVLLLTVIGQAGSVTRGATEKISAFQGARSAFQRMEETLGQATLAGYWDYDNPVNPSRYLRKSDLHFVVGGAGTGVFPGTAGTGQAVFFQFPGGRTGRGHLEGLVDMLNACGYFIVYGDDGWPAPFPSGGGTYRYRLMQSQQSAEELGVLDRSGGDLAWISGLAAEAAPIADNVIYLMVWPRRSPVEDVEGGDLTGDFSYDTRTGAFDDPQPETGHQLPPVVQLTIVALDEASAARVCTTSSPPAVVSGAFAGLFENASQTQFELDLATLESRLAGANLGFRVFTTLVPIRESKML